MIPATRADAAGASEEAEVLRASLAVGPVEIRAGGVSMRPRLRPGDTVRVERRLPRRGDVVLAVCGGRLFLHRAVRRRPHASLLHGDAQAYPDGWIRDADVLAVATARRARPGERRGPWRRLDGRLDRWLALATLALLAPLRRARAGHGAPRAAPTRRAAPPPGGSPAGPGRRASRGGGARADPPAPSATAPRMASRPG